MLLLWIILGTLFGIIIAGALLILGVIWLLNSASNWKVTHYSNKDTTC